MKIEVPICPLCNCRLYYRSKAKGFICKNWKCKNYWKLGKSTTGYIKIDNF